MTTQMALLVLSGKVPGFLPEHYAESFVTRGADTPGTAGSVVHVCEFSAIVRHAPPPTRVVQTLLMPWWLSSRAGQGARARGSVRICKRAGSRLISP